jgi:uncharacterized membrane protein YcaP (DUF421 family)
MQDALDVILGLNRHELEWQHMAARAVLIFIFALALVRIGGMRTFGKNAPFDVIVGIILGSVLSRALTGNAPFFPSMLASLLLVLLHRALATAVCYHSGLERLIKGEKMLLAKDGRSLEKNMKKNMISESDLNESLRGQGHIKSVAEVDEAYFETNGKISVIPKK